MSEILSVVIGLSVVIAPIGVSLVSFYFILQVGIFGFYWNDMFDEFTEKRYSTDENGLFYRDKKTWWHKFCFLGKHFHEMFIERQYVIRRATNDAVRSAYRNCFAETRIQKLYDATFKEKRMKMIVEAAEADAKYKNARKFSNTEAEQAIYQEEYLKALLKISNLQEVLNKRAAGLYDGNNSEPIDFKKFKEFVEAA